MTRGLHRHTDAQTQYLRQQLNWFIDGVTVCSYTAVWNWVCVQNGTIREPRLRHKGCLLFLTRRRNVQTQELTITFVFISSPASSVLQKDNCVGQGRGREMRSFECLQTECVANPRTRTSPGQTQSTDMLPRLSVCHLQPSQFKILSISLSYDVCCMS